MKGPKTARICYRLGAQSANGGEGHADRATDRRRAAGREQLERIGVDDGVAIRAAVDARRQEQDTPLAGFLDRRAQPVVSGAAVVEHLDKERRRRRGIQFEAGLLKNVLGQSEGVAVRVQVACVFLEQGQDPVDLLVAPAPESGGVLELALHGVALGAASGGQRAPIAIGPGMRETEQSENLDHLLSSASLVAAWT